MKTGTTGALVFIAKTAKPGVVGAFFPKKSAHIPSLRFALWSIKIPTTRF
jgi:hypothetical protein